MARLIFHIDVNSAFLSWEATRRVGGAVKDLLIAGIGGQQTALNGSFQQKHNDQAVHHRQITIVQPHTVANPEQRGKHHNRNGHPLELPAAGDPALHQHHHHEVEAHDDKIAHDDVIEPVIAVFQIKVDEAIVKHENLLVQVVGKNGNQHNRGRNQKAVQLFRMGIILRLAQIIDDKRTQSGDEQHTHIEAVPEVAHQRMGHAAGEIPFDNFVNEPEQEQAPTISISRRTFLLPSLRCTEITQENSREIWIVSRIRQMTLWSIALGRSSYISRITKAIAIRMAAMMA